MFDATEYNFQKKTQFYYSVYFNFNRSFFVVYKCVKINRFYSFAHSIEKKEINNKTLQITNNSKQFSVQCFVCGQDFQFKTEHENKIL